MHAATAMGPSMAGCARRTNANNTCPCTRKSLIRARVGTTFTIGGVDKPKMRSRRIAPNGLVRKASTRHAPSLPLAACGALLST